MLAAFVLSAAVLTASDPACADPVMAGVNGATLPEIVGAKAKPEYPSNPQGIRAAGRVLMNVLVCQDGRVHDVVPVLGIPWSRSLDESAAAAVRKWRYRPATRNGNAIAVWMPTSITFDTDVIRGPAWWDSEVNLRLHDTTLDKALAVFEKAGVKVEYLGSAPAVHASYEKERVQEVLDDLARKYALEMDLVAPTRLRVKALPGPGTAGIEPPVLETRSDPRRPDLHGTVDMNLVVGADGTVQTATVVRPSGKADFDADALESVRSWRYRPATQQGKPVPVYVPIRIER